MGTSQRLLLDCLMAKQTYPLLDKPSPKGSARTSLCGIQATVITIMLRGQCSRGLPPLQARTSYYITALIFDHRLAAQVRYHSLRPASLVPGPTGELVLGRYPVPPERLLIHAHVMRQPSEQIQLPFDEPQHPLRRRKEPDVAQTPSVSHQRAAQVPE